MNTINVKKSTSLRLDSELYSYIEKHARKEKRSVNNFIEMVLADATKFKIPNKETARALKEAKEEKASLRRYTNTDSLFDDLAK